MNDINRIVQTALRVLEYPILKLGSTQLTVLGIIQLLAWLAVVVVLERMLRRYLLERVLRRTHLDTGLQYGISRIAGYIFIALGFYVAIQVAGIDLSSLAIIAGAIGVGIGFGLQNIVSNFVSGLIILAERPIAIGHRIEVGGVAGRVTRINLRSTAIVTNDNITIIVPNSDFIAHAITNWSYGDPKVRIRLPVGVAYGTDLEKLQRVLLDVAARNPQVLKDPAPAVRFLGFGDSSFHFELAVWTVDMSHRPTRFRSDLYFAIERELRENHIEIPFPQRDLHLKSGHFIVQPPPPTAPPAGATT
jgi:small-conductance mechanosensitive channel